MPVRFTQYLMPDGRAVPVDIDLDVLTEARATWLRNAGYRFEIEMLQTPVGAIGEIAKKIAGIKPGEQMPDILMEIMTPPGHDEDALCGRLAVNGPDVVTKAVEMIEDGHMLVFRKREKQP